jgi:hypothetical protein
MASTFPVFKTVRDKTEGHVIKWLLDAMVSKRTETIRGGGAAIRAIRVGMVLGRQLFGAPAIGAAVGAGDGALGALALGRQAKVGDYVLTCIEAAANGGRFQVVDPEGLALADALVGVAYASPQIAFTVADGAADFVVGDTITVTVPAGDGKLAQIDPAATDGTQIAAAIATERLDVPVGTDMMTSPVISDAAVLETALVWPDGIAAGDKAAATADLVSNRITMLQGA